VPWGRSQSMPGPERRLFPGDFLGIHSVIS
jgi:hypothetical protein